MLINNLKPVKWFLTFLAASLMVLSLSLVVWADAGWEKTVTGIEITGNRTVTTEAILGAVKTKIGDKVTEDILRKEMGNISDLGYFYNVSVKYGDYKNGVKLTFEVQENPRLNGIEIIGNTVYPTEKLLGLLKMDTGSVINTKKLNEGLGAIRALYESDGYVYESIGDVGIDVNGNLKISILEGRLEGYKIEGELKTKKNVITREMNLVPGELFNVKRIQDNFQKIKNLGFFDDVGYRVEPGQEPGGVVFVFIPKEGRTGEFSGGLTYSSSDGLLGTVSVAQHDFRGLGQDIKVSFELGSKKTNYELSFYDPWIDSKHTSFGAGIYNTTKTKEDPDVVSSITKQVQVGDQTITQTIDNTNEYESKEKGWSVTVGRPLNENTRINFKLNFKDTDSKPLENSLVTAKKESTRSITVSTVTDTRDDPFNPTRGRRDSYSFEYAGQIFGGDTNFTKGEFDLRRYYKVGNSQTMAFRLMGGTTGGNPPDADLFDIGGADTVRGYKDNAFEGNKMLVFNAEYRFPVTKSVQGHVFYDAGTVGDAGIDPANSKLKQGYGLGANLNTPIGPIRLDYGFGSGKPILHFSMGQSF